MGDAAGRALAHVAGLALAGAADSGWRVTLNFHPDRRLMLESLLADGVYVSQFVTRTGNGGLTARPGGDRWLWESRIFAGAYDDAPAHERPVYGALNFRRKVVGGAPGFGSAHLRLTADVLSRSTYCYPDSHAEPAHFGVAGRMGLVAVADADDVDVLDDYVEAQVHEPVRLERDVEALVLDPSYRGTAVESAARRFPCPVEWHPGFRLSVDELREHPGYRGPQYVDLGARIAVDGMLTPRVIGAALGRYGEQDLKRVWHYLARFGDLSCESGGHGAADCGGWGRGLG